MKLSMTTTTHEEIMREWDDSNTTLRWSADTDEYTKTLVYGNLNRARAFFEKALTRSNNALLERVGEEVEEKKYTSVSKGYQSQLVKTYNSALDTVLDIIKRFKE